MANYELMLIAEPFLEDEEHQAMVEKVQEQLKRRGGNITNVDPWGKRRLAYPINKKLEGYYALFTFDGEIDGAGIAETERVLRLDEQVMRLMITRIPEPKVIKRKQKAANKAAAKAAEAEAHAPAETHSAGQAGQPVNQR